jgi:hypothetical protein
VLQWLMMRAYLPVRPGGNCMDAAVIRSSSMAAATMQYVLVRTMRVWLKSAFPPAGAHLC